jgi:hypothetical protein
MATWSTITQTGGGQWWVAGGGITNHVGALISDVSVFLDEDNTPNQTSYRLVLSGA